MPGVRASVNGFWRRRQQAQGEKLCVCALSQARDPVFYTNWGVPDTLEGRFDCASLHIALLLRHIKGPLAQALFNAFFSYTELTLREVGVGDLRVGKQVKNCAKFFYGAMKSYHDALENKASLEDALLRNLYGEESPSFVYNVVDYVRECDSLLEKQDFENVMSIQWPQESLHSSKAGD